MNNIYEFRSEKVPTTSRASDAPLEELLTFERLLFDLSARFANVAGNQVVAEVEYALMQLLKFLGFDRGTLTEHTDEGKQHFVCSVAVEGVEPFVPGPIPAHQSWFTKELRSGRTVTIRSYEDFPPEAAATAEYYRGIGMLCMIVLPLFVGGHLAASIGFGSFRFTREWSDEFIARVKVIGEVMAQALIRKRSEAADASLEELLTFERLLADLSARFANASGDQVEMEIESALKQLLKFLDFDRGAIGRFNTDGWYSILVSVGTERVEPFPRGPVPSFLSWYFGQLRADKIVSVRSIDELPPEAIGEIEYYRRSGIRSSLAIPLRVGGHVVGAIAFSAFHSTREWPDELIVRLKIIGEVIAQALVRKRSDEALRASEAETARLMRQALVGELSGTIAHELNQPLAAILLNAETAQLLIGQKNVDLGRIQEIVADIIEADRRASEVIGNVRKLLKKGESRSKLIDLNRLIELTMHLLRGELMKHKVNIDFVPAKNLPMISGDRVQLQQVLLNLIMNAMEATSAKTPSQRVINITSRANEEKMEVAIVDCGSGVAAEDQTRLFQPFFTTKQHGLGLGLSICTRIIKAHGGTLSIENNAGDGATAIVALPTPGPDHVRASPLSDQS